MSYLEILEKARNLTHQAKTLMDENEGDAWTQETQNQIDALLDKADQLKGQAEQAKRIDSGIAFFDAPASNPVPTANDLPDNVKQQFGGDELDMVTANKEYTEAFTTYLKGGMARLTPKQQTFLQRGFIENDNKESKTLTGNTGVDGGFLTPPDFRNTLIEEKAEMSQLRNYVNVMPTSGSHLEMPKVEGATGANAGIYANGVVFTYVNSPDAVDDGETEPEFGALRIPIHDAVAKTRLGLNLVNDSMVNIEARLPAWYGQAAGLRTDYDILVGTGRGMPLGILKDTDVTGTFFVQTDSAGAVGADDLLDLVYDLEEQYAMNAKWITSRTNLLAVRKFQDGNGNYIWQPGLKEGEPDTLLGYEVLQSSFSPSIATGNFPFVFGDLMNYSLGENQRVTIVVIREKYIEQLKIGYMAWFRQGGQVAVPRGFRVLKVQ